jgi:hypothetical protein
MFRSHAWRPHCRGLFQMPIAEFATHRQISGLFALEDSADVDTGQTVCIGQAGAHRLTRLANPSVARHHLPATREPQFCTVRSQPFPMKSAPKKGRSNTSCWSSPVTLTDQLSQSRRLGSILIKSRANPLASSRAAATSGSSNPSTSSKGRSLVMPK